MKVEYRYDKERMHPVDSKFCHVWGKLKVESLSRQDLALLCFRAGYEQGVEDIEQQIAEDEAGESL